MRLPFEPLPARPDPPLADLGLVGDGHSAALVGSDSSVLWWCPQRFDAPSVFAALLDHERGGRFATGTPRAHRVELEYVDATNVLRSLVTTMSGRAAITTFMPFEEAQHPGAEERRLLRKVECLEGHVDLSVELEPAFDYARQAATLEVDALGAVARPADGPERLRLSSSVPLELDDGHEGRAGATFQLTRGESQAFVLTHSREGEPRAVSDPVGLVDDALARELSFWPGWISRCTYEGPYERAVQRSLLALKLMQYVPTGAFVAAPTMALPEVPGMDQNWDYRYSWLRDGSFIVMAFDTTGFEDETLRFRRWLGEVVKRDAPDQIQTVYRVDGGRDIPEAPLDHLRGFRDSRPVYLGNKAVEQRQLDTYGEVMMCYHRAPRLLAEQGDLLWPALHALVDKVCETWDEPDAGIWEIRSEHLHHVHSKAMAWIALNHGVRIARDHGYEAPLEHWERGAHRLRERIERDGWSSTRGAYKEAYGSDTPDAALLLLPLFGYIDPRSERARGTAERLEKELAGHGRVHRHFSESRGNREGAFLPASLWLAHDLAHLGRLDDARRYVDATLAVAGPLGLLPEEAESVSGAGLGNHPQALTHLSLVLTAYAIGHPEEGGRVDAITPDERRPRAR